MCLCSNLHVHVSYFIINYKLIFSYVHVHVPRYTVHVVTMELPIVVHVHVVEYRRFHYTYTYMYKCIVIQHISLFLNIHMYMYYIVKEMMESHNVSHVTQRGSLVDSIEEYESTADRAKRRWQWAINQQLLLIRLEKANQSVIRETLRRHRLNYADPAVDNVVMGRVWLRLLEEDRVSSEDLLAAIKMGNNTCTCTIHIVEYYMFLNCVYIYSMYIILTLLCTLGVFNSKLHVHIHSG